MRRKSLPIAFLMLASMFVAAQRAGYHLLTGQILLRLDQAADAANDAAYVADHWTSPDRDEAMELWNLVPAGKRPAQGPAEIAERHDVSRAEGIVKSVTCHEDDVTMTLEQDGQPLIFRVQHNAACGFSDTLWFGADHFTPCYQTVGLRAVVQYKPAAEKSLPATWCSSASAMICEPRQLAPPLFLRRNDEWHRRTLDSLCQFAPALATESANIRLLNHFDHGGTTPVILAYATSWPMCSLL